MPKVKVTSLDTPAKQRAAADLMIGKVSGHIKPSPYDLTDPVELARLLREVEGYLHTCRDKHHGTDFEGRRYAMDAIATIRRDHRVQLLPRFTVSEA